MPQQHEIPQNIADGDRLAAEVCNRSIEFLGPKFLHALDRIVMNAFETGSQLFDCSRPVQPWRAGIRRDSSALDPKASVTFDLRQMPGQLAERAPFGIGTEVISVARQGFQQLDRFRGLAFLQVVETFELVFHGMTPPPSDLYSEIAETATRVSAAARRSSPSRSVRCASSTARK